MKYLEYPFIFTHKQFKNYIEKIKEHNKITMLELFEDIERRKKRK